jgi:hypothetical protein
MPSIHSSQVASGRYESDGEFYLQFPADFLNDPDFQAFRRLVGRNVPAGAFDYDDVFNPSTLWVNLQYAQRVEAIALLVWPGMRVIAWGNAAYSPQHNVTRQLAQARQAVAAAEAAVRCGLAVGR